MMDLKNIAKELNLRTTEELRDNFLSYDGYIELTIPIGNIHMISKEIFEAKTFEEAKTCSLNYQCGNFEDWRLPTEEELDLIYQISKTFPDIMANNTTFWSSSTTKNPLNAWAVDFIICGGGKSQDKEIPNNVILIR